MASAHNLVWFRSDLRIADNPALHQACRNGDKVSAVFFITPQQWRDHHLSERRLQFTYNALESLAEGLAELGIHLTIIKTKNFKSLSSKLIKLCAELECQQLYCNYEYAFDELQRDKDVEQRCRESGVELFRFNASVIIPPGKILTQQEVPFKVFTPFKRAWLQKFNAYDRKPLAKPKARNRKLSIKFRPLVTKPDLIANWPASENEAHRRLKQFINKKIEAYQDQRDLPAIDGTSTLSPYLAQGIISPLSVLQAARFHNQGELAEGNKHIATWINEIIWREFYIHLMVAYPQVCKYQALKPDTEKVPWRHHEKDFKLWCDGKTGYPLVDAAMKQLNTTGWMHNRLRMVTATFLSKYLLLDWRWGERYFMENLVDGHIAANNGGWQWCASTGTDAAPYFRILSPVRQGERFDPDAAFIKQYLPQLQDLPAKVIHKPGHPDLLKTGYPKPMVDLKFGKDRCLQAFKSAA